jgi:magnesium chelatase family protein
MDRIDIRVVLARPSDAELGWSADVEGSDTVRGRVQEARDRSARRFAGLPWRLNSEMPSGELRRSWQPEADAAELLRAVERRAANLRGPDRVLRMAWSVADLAGHARPRRDDVALALGLRGAGTSWTS